MRSNLVVYFDDLTGEQIPLPQLQQRTFGIDGEVYELDLGAASSRKLDEALAQYIAAGRKQPTAKKGQLRGSSVRTVELRPFAFDQATA